MGSEAAESNGEFIIFKKPEKLSKAKPKSEPVSAVGTYLQADEGLPRRNTVSDASEGRTLFIRNVPFDSDEDSLQQYLSTFGQLEFVKIVRDKFTKHSRGSAFAKFVSKEDADNVLFRYAKPFSAADFMFGGRKLDIVLAVSKEEVAKLQTFHRVEWASAISGAGSRNLHLARIGLIKPGSKAAEGLTPHEMKMRETLARSKQAKLRDPEIFISPLRLCLRNIPLSVDDRQLRAACQRVAGSQARITECRVMRDVKSGAVNPKSLGFAFVAFEEHEDALKTLQVLNNNNGILGGNRKPIVEFSLENSRALEKKRRRQEKSMVMQESKALSENPRVGRLITAKSKASKRVGKQLKGRNNLRRPIRVMPKKLGFKTNKKRKLSNVFSFVVFWVWAGRLHGGGNELS
ncbi:hypothetical protein Aperf_G00000046425 [Anoplocephala perfoliata]